MYCLYSLLALLFLKMASHALAVWFLFLDDPNELKPSIFFIYYSSSSTSSSPSAYYASFCSFSSLIFSVSFYPYYFYLRLGAFRSLDLERDSSSSLESSLMSCSLARRALRSSCLFDSLIILKYVMMSSQNRTISLFALFQHIRLLSTSFPKETTALPPHTRSHCPHYKGY